MVIGGLGEIADSFDAVLVDQWGVLHDGHDVFAAARDCLDRLHGAGKRVAILSNSGKRAEENRRRLTALGLPESAYDHLLTSGEAAWMGLRDRAGPPFDRLGRRCLLITRDRDRSVVDGTDLKPVDDVAAAEFILLAGVDEGAGAPEAWRAVFAEGVRRGLPMLCANPDLAMFGAAGLVPGPGSLAAFFESLGGRVEYVGKPHAPIFAAAARLLGNPPPDRVLVIGDSLDHDVRGGNRAGMATALIAGGVHAAALHGLADPGALVQAVERLAGEAGKLPRWILAELTW
jgi:HAD superfamily hydrolase (TIGR01459 family)